MPPRHGRNNEEERVAQKEDQDVLHFTQQPFSLSHEGMRVGILRVHKTIINPKAQGHWVDLSHSLPKKRETMGVD